MTKKLVALCCLVITSMFGQESPRHTRKQITLLVDTIEVGAVRMEPSIKSFTESEKGSAFTSRRSLQRVVVAPLEIPRPVSRFTHISLRTIRTLATPGCSERVS